MYLRVIPSIYDNSMSKKNKSLYGKVIKHESKPKGTNIGRNPITSTMNKNQRRSFKKYRGQGR